MGQLPQLDKTILRLVVELQAFDEVFVNAIILVILDCAVDRDELFNAEPFLS